MTAPTEDPINRKLVIILLSAHTQHGTNPTRLCQALKPCGHIHAVTINLIAIDDDITQVDADAKLQLAQR